MDDFVGTVLGVVMIGIAVICLVALLVAAWPLTLLGVWIWMSNSKNEKTEEESEVEEA